LAGILLEVADGQLSLSAFDFDVAARGHLDVTGDSPGRALVSGRLLDAIAKTFPNKPVDVAADGTRLTVKCGSLKLTLPLMVAEDYPALPDMPPAIGTVVASEFAAMVDRVGIAADVSGSTAVKAFRGIHVTFIAEQIELLGTDRFRGAIGHMPWQANDPLVNEVSLIPAPALLELAKGLNGPHDLTVGIDGNGLVGFATIDRSLVVRPLAEDFPLQLREMFPPQSDAPATVTTTELALALKRANLVRAPQTGAYLTFNADGLTVEAKGEGGATETGETISCDYSGPDMTLVVNPQYLGDALAGLRSITAEISFTAPRKPIRLSVPDDTEQKYAHIIVPISPR
jgi:DNA polymerase-3 subunit beta